MIFQFLSGEKLKEAKLNQFKIIGMRKIFFVAALLTTVMSSIEAQRIALKTNSLYWIGLTPNIGVEFLGEKTSVDIEFGGSPFSITKNVYFQPEIKFWFNKVLTKSYIGIEPVYAYYNYNIFKKQGKGSALGVGLNYGYSFLINQRFNIEPLIGGKYLRTTNRDNSQKKNAFIPNIGLNLTYVLK